MLGNRIFLTSDTVELKFLTVGLRGNLGFLAESIFLFCPRSFLELALLFVLTSVKLNVPPIDCFYPPYISIAKSI